MACQGTFVADHALVARSVPDVAVLILSQSCDVAVDERLELIDIVAEVGQTRFLGTYPQQVGIVDVDALDADDLLRLLAVVGTDGLYVFHLVVVHVGANQSCAVGTYPDVAVAVACHAVHAVVHADAGQSQLVADVRVPYVGVLVVEHQRSLTVEPDVIHLVGKGLEGVRLAQSLTGYLVGLPNGVLLVHDVAAYQLSVVIDEHGTIATLADGADDTLGNAVGVVGIAELIAGLLLHVIGNDSLVGNRCPHVLMAVDIHHVGMSLDAHASEGLLHVALEVLRLWVVDAETCRCLHEQGAFQRLLDADDIAVGER